MKRHLLLGAVSQLITPLIHFRRATIQTLFITTICLFLGWQAMASTYISAGSGNWSTAGTWTSTDGGTTFPGSGDTA